MCSVVGERASPSDGSLSPFSTSTFGAIPSLVACEVLHATLTLLPRATNNGRIVSKLHLFLTPYEFVP